MNLAFEARALAVGEDPVLDLWFVSLADDADRPGAELHLLKTVGDDEVAEEPGMNSYSVVLAGGATHYGGVTACVLRGEHLRLELDRDAALTLGVQVIEVWVPLGPERRADLARGLRRVFEGDPFAPALLHLGP